MWIFSINIKSSISLSTSVDRTNPQVQRGSCMHCSSILNKGPEHQHFGINRGSWNQSPVATESRLKFLGSQKLCADFQLRGGRSLIHVLFKGQLYFYITGSSIGLFIQASPQTQVMHCTMTLGWLRRHQAIVIFSSIIILWDHSVPAVHP